MSGASSRNVLDEARIIGRDDGPGGNRGTIAEPFASNGEGYTCEAKLIGAKMAERAGNRLLLEPDHSPSQVDSCGCQADETYPLLDSASRPAGLFKFSAARWHSFVQGI